MYTDMKLFDVSFICLIYSSVLNRMIRGIRFLLKKKWHPAAPGLATDDTD